MAFLRCRRVHTFMSPLDMSKLANPGPAASRLLIATSKARPFLKFFRQRAPAALHVRTGSAGR